jgi:proteasome lid subunit RPN8/RPN11
MLAHSCDAAPAECCGILLGSAGTIIEAVRARNQSANPNRYHIDPADHLAARREARRRGLEVVGFYHSHPHSVAEPSPTDIAEATYPSHIYAIVSLAGEPAQVRLYLLEGGSFREEPFVVIDERLTTND